MAQGNKKSPHKIKVKAIKEDGIVYAELAEPPAKLKFKKLREEKMNKQARESVEKKKTLMEKAKESFKGTPGEKAEKAEPSEKTEENKEKEKASAIATQQMEKETAKQIKHETKMKPTESKHQRRMALQK